MEVSLFLCLLPRIIFSIESVLNILRVFINVKNIIRNFL